MDEELIDRDAIAAKALASSLTRAQRMYVKDGSIHGDCTMATVRALKAKGVFELVIDSPNGQCGFMRLTALGERVRAALSAGRLTDEKLLLALGDGGRTWQIARRCTPRQSTATTRRRLARLEAAGKVERSERYTYANDIYWVPVSPDDRADDLAA